MTKMNPEVKARWVEALRSGDYRQGEAGLRRGDDEFCCLGVLCDIATKEDVVKDVQPAAPGDTGSWTMYDGFAGVLPPSVRAWAGLEEPDPRFGLDGKDSSLTRLNDEGKYSFQEIADVIEEQL